MILRSSISVALLPQSTAKNLASLSESIDSTISVCLYYLAIVVYLDYFLGHVRRDVQDCVVVFVGQYLHDLAILAFDVFYREEIYLCSYVLLIKTYNISLFKPSKDLAKYHNIAIDWSKYERLILGDHAKMVKNCQLNTNPYLNPLNAVVQHGHLLKFLPLQ